MTFRRAVISDLPTLRALARTSEAVWGFDETFLTVFDMRYNLTEGFLTTQPVFLIEDGERMTAGFWGMDLTAEPAELAYLYVDVTRIRGGVGRILWKHLTEWCRESGIDYFRFDTSQPAVGFYERMGATVTGTVFSKVDGRPIPTLEYYLPLSREAYLRDPCGTLSIPYWKCQAMTPCPGLRILHDRAFSGTPAGWMDTPYFRLLHLLRDIPDFPAPTCYALLTAAEAEDTALADLICACYPDIRVKAGEVTAWRRKSVYRPELWITARTGKGKLAGAAIGEYDSETEEAVVEWVQVRAEYRGCGLGKSLVCELLRRIARIAAFATVSGKQGGPTAPEALYRACGFTGNDVWHVLRREEE